ncbi:hypothetical protein ACWEN6_13915 [Sphaerisporangium sp. NPDC004334]
MKLRRRRVDPMELWQLSPGDVVRLPNHHPPEVEVDDINLADPASWHSLYAVAWKTTGDDGGERESGVTSLSKNALVVLVSTPDPTKQMFAELGARPPVQEPDEQEKRTTMTPIARGVLNLARERGFTTQCRRPFAGQVEVSLHLDGPRHLTGRIVLGFKSGRILRASITNNRTQEKHHAKGANAVRQLITDLT